MCLNTHLLWFPPCCAHQRNPKSHPSAEGHQQILIKAFVTQTERFELERLKLSAAPPYALHTKGGVFLILLIQAHPQGQEGKKKKKEA